MRGTSADVLISQYLDDRSTRYSIGYESSGNACTLVNCEYEKTKVMNKANKKKIWQYALNI